MGNKRGVVVETAVAALALLGMAAVLVGSLVHYFK